MGYARIAVRHTVVLMVCLRFGQGQFEFRLMMAFSITCHLYTSYTVWMLKSHGHLLVLRLMYWSYNCSYGNPQRPVKPQQHSSPQPNKHTNSQHNCTNTPDLRVPLPARSHFDLLIPICSADH